MKLFWIARRELGSYFTTWTGYVIAALCLFINGLLFNAIAIGNKAEYSANVLSNFFYFASGIAVVAGIFLSMRLVAEEKQSGTIVLFYTSPISEREFIYGKFLSAVGFFLFLQCLSLYMPALIFLEGKISFGHLAAGYLGVILLGSSVLSIGLLCSTIAPNQLLAAIACTVTSVTLLVFWMLSNVVDQPFKDLFLYLAIHNDHFDPFRKGIIHTKHVVYYLSVVIFCCEAAVRTLQAKRWQGT